MTSSEHESRLLAVCRAIGRFLGVLVAVAFLLLLWVGQRTVVSEQRRSEASANAFISRVRACRRDAVGPVPSWEFCERRVRSEL
jgi:hypothetical protein